MEIWIGSNLERSIFFFMFWSQVFCSLITSECIILIQFFAICEGVDPLGLLRLLIIIIIYKMLRNPCNIFWVAHQNRRKTYASCASQFSLRFWSGYLNEPRKYYNESLNHYPFLKPSALMASCTPPLQWRLCVVLWYPCMMCNLLVHRLVGFIGSLTSHSKIFQLYLWRNINLQAAWRRPYLDRIDFYCAIPR